VVPARNLSRTFVNLLPDTEYIVEVTANVGDIKSKTGAEKANTGKE